MHTEDSHSPEPEAASPATESSATNRSSVRSGLLRATAGFAAATLGLSLLLPVVRRHEFRAMAMSNLPEQEFRVALKGLDQRIIEETELGKLVREIEKSEELQAILPESERVPAILLSLMTGDLNNNVAGLYRPFSDELYVADEDASFAMFSRLFGYSGSIGTILHEQMHALHDHYDENEWLEDLMHESFSGRGFNERTWEASLSAELVPVMGGERFNLVAKDPAARFALAYGERTRGESFFQQLIKEEKIDIEYLKTIAEEGVGRYLGAGNEARESSTALTEVAAYIVNTLSGDDELSVKEYEKLIVSRAKGSSNAVGDENPDLRFRRAFEQVTTIYALHSKALNADFSLELHLAVSKDVGGALYSWSDLDFGYTKLQERIDELQLSQGLSEGELESERQRWLESQVGRVNEDSERVRRITRDYIWSYKL